MTVNYKGKDENFDYRLAEISFNERTEQRLMDKIEYIMNNVRGWNLNSVTNGYAMCEVADYDEYKSFVKEYKEVKKSAMLQIRFGI